ncbi:hypothetical protein DFH09DRAFT_1509381 [Mycena vulgaris]|nr:hypothetical protein DFH09DRAFT_1509381 [Mycena vulgaris]
MPAISASHQITRPGDSPRSTPPPTSPTGPQESRSRKPPTPPTSAALDSASRSPRPTPPRSTSSTSSTPGLNGADADALVLWAMPRRRLRLAAAAAAHRCRSPPPTPPPPPTPLKPPMAPAAAATTGGIEAVAPPLGRNAQQVSPSGMHQRRGRWLERVWQLPGSGGTDTRTQRLLLVVYYRVVEFIQG